MVSFVVKLADIKHKSPEVYLVKFKENLLCGFKIMDLFFFFFKNRVSKKLYILEDFCSIKN